MDAVLHNPEGTLPIAHGDCMDMNEDDRVPCDRCGDIFDRDDLIPTDTGVYCEACFEETDGGRV